MIDTQMHASNAVLPHSSDHAGRITADFEAPPVEAGGRTQRRLDDWCKRDGGSGRREPVKSVGNRLRPERGSRRGRLGL